MVRIKVALSLSCSADAAWRAAHSPDVAERLYRPLLSMRPRNGARFPTAFETGTRIDVALLLCGVCALGTQRIVIEDLVTLEAGHETKTMRDAGRPLSGPLALLASWNHEITISPISPRTTIWRDELTIGGWFSPVAALVLWPMWRWRALKLRRLSRDWEIA